jgi:Holliday junction resolvase RusA-like endonuclease
MFQPISIFVAGDPKGQPRIKASSFGGFVRCYTPLKVKNAKTGKYHEHPAEIWGRAIEATWKSQAPAAPKITTPVSLTLVFKMPRPKSHLTKKCIREGQPVWCASKPDCDNLAKLCLDRLTKLGVWEDDDQVVILKVVKQYATGANGCEITLKDAAI